MRCRPFNRMTTTQDGRLLKEGIDEQGNKLAKREKAWYRYVIEKGFSKIPEIDSFEPFVMERINGKNIFEYELTSTERRTILEKIVATLDELHALGSSPTDYFSIKDAYITKTFDRLSTIRAMLPFANERYITVNGRKCRNVFFYIDELKARFESYRANEFQLLHGDCTFSNMMLRDDSEPVLIDPRGYFGYTEFYGDVAYDWAKLYYSIFGNYDQFNIKNFDLTMEDNTVQLDIVSNGWEDMGDILLKMAEPEIKAEDIQLIHSIIWLSLTTYAWEDYDSICGAFYNGLYYLEEVL